MRALVNVFLGVFIILGTQLFAFAGGPSVSGGGFPQNAMILSDQSACPPGWTEVTAYQGFSLWAQAASGTAGETLGTGRAANTTDLTLTATSSTPTITCTNPANLSMIGAGGYCDDSPAPTMTAPVITMGATADTRGEFVPSVALRLCKKG